MKIKSTLLSLIFVLFFYLSCSEKEDLIELTEPELTEYENSVINYFNDIALGFEFGNASQTTRKWNTDLKIFVGGSPTPELLNELESIKNEINLLVSDGFRIQIVNDVTQSNFFIFLGTGNDYANLYPSQSSLIVDNLGLFRIFWNGNNHIISGHMYVDIERANSIAQKHLLREELTQSLGLAKDSPLYDDSIFQSQWTTTIEYAIIDKDLIQLLYHPEMQAGLNESEVSILLENILLNN